MRRDNRKVIETAMAALLELITLFESGEATKEDIEYAFRGLSSLAMRLTPKEEVKA